MDIDLKHEITPEIVNALCQSYFAGFVVDLNANAYQTLFYGPWLSNVPEKGKFSALVDMLVKQYLRGDDCLRITKILAIENLREQLSKKYQTPEGGVNFYADYQSYRYEAFRYCRAVSCPLEYEDDQYPSKILVMLQDITALKVRELEDQNRNKQALEALCIDYSAAYLVDLSQDTMEHVKTQHYWDTSKLFKDLREDELSYSKWLMLSWDELLVKESCPDFLHYFDPQVLRAYFADHDVFVVRIRVKPNEAGCEWFEVKAVKFYEDKNSYQIILGYRSIDDIVAAEIEHQIMLRKNQQSEIIAAMATIYSVIIVIDLVTHEYELVEDKNILHFLIGHNGRIEEIIDKAVQSVVSPDYQNAMHKFFDFSDLEERLAFKNTIETVFQHVNGHWYNSSFIVKKRDEKSRAVKVLYVSRDITESKEHELQLQQELKDNAEDAKRANLSKTAFLRRMSHDIRTPLNGIIGMLHVVEKYENDPQKRRDCREKILNSADYLMDLVNNVLDISKLESGAIVLDEQPFHLGKQLYKLLDIVGQSANENGITLEGGACISHLVHRNVIGSSLHLQRILMNVASNSIKYNRRGGMLRLSCNEISSDGDTAVYEFECIDNGLGMSEDFIEHAFEPFAQEGKETTTSFSGSGLGLSIVKDITELMGGRVELESKENVGTRVKITVPLKIDKSQHLITEEQLELKALNLKGMKALLVEDNVLNMEIACMMLEEIGFEVIKAKNGQEAIELFEKSAANEYSFIFMDVMMPVMDGLEATKHIRAMDREDAQSIPIIAMTANAFAEDKKVCADAGMTDHVSKPIELNNLKRVIANHIL